jgi:hypothetical protein
LTACNMQLAICNHSLQKSFKVKLSLSSEPCSSSSVLYLERKNVEAHWT